MPDPTNPTTTTPAETPAVREAILAAAKTEFAAHGLKGSSVRAIGTRAGVTAAMINYYFGGKVPLYEAVVEAAIGRLTEDLVSAVIAGEESDVASRLAGAYFDFLVQEREIQRLLARQVLDRTEGVPIAQRYLVPIRTALESRMKLDDETVQSAVSLFGAIAGYFFYEPVLAELLEGDPLTEEALARRRTHIMKLAAFLSATTGERP